MYGPILEGERVRLEPPEADLAPLYCRWFADTEVNLYTLRFPPSPKMAQDWLDKVAESEKDVMWMVKVDGRPIGAVQVETINWHHRRAEVAIIIGEKAEWGKGYGAEALRLVTRFAFEELNLEKLIGEAIAENGGSIRAMERAGFRQWGVARRHFYQKGRWSDAWFGEVLRDEWARSATV